MIWEIKIFEVKLYIIMRSVIIVEVFYKGLWRVKRERTKFYINIIIEIKYLETINATIYFIIKIIKKGFINYYWEIIVNNWTTKKYIITFIYREVFLVVLI